MLDTGRPDPGEPGRAPDDTAAGRSKPDPAESIPFFTATLPTREITFWIRKSLYDEWFGPSEEAPSDRPGNADAKPWVQQPYVVRTIVRASEFVGFLAQHLPVVGPEADDPPAPARLSPVILDELTELARNLDAAIHPCCHGKPVDIEPARYYISWEPFFAFQVLNYLFYELLASWGWSGGWGPPDDGIPILPGAARGIRGDRLAELKQCLEAFPPPVHLHDDRMVCQGCGSYHPPEPATDDAAHTPATNGDGGHAPGPGGRPEGTTIPIDEFAAQILALYNGKATTTRSKMRAALGYLMGVPGVETIADVTPEALMECVGLMEGRGLSPVTIGDVRKDLRAIFNLAVNRGWLARNPVDGTPAHWQRYGAAAGLAAPRKDRLTAGEVTRLMVHLRQASIASWEGHRLFALVAVVALAALRRNEALGLEVEDFDLAGSRLRLNKGAEARRGRTLRPELVEILRDWLPRTACRWAFPGTKLMGPWNDGPPGKKPIDQVKAAGLDVGIEGLTFERLREFGEAHAGRMRLGRVFLDLPTPERTYEGPKPGKPGARSKPRPETPPLRMPLPVALHGEDAPQDYWGVREAEPLGETAYGILKVMVDYGCNEGRRISTRELRLLADVRNPGDALKRFDESGPPASKGLISFPTKERKGEGYGFNPLPPHIRETFCETSRPAASSQIADPGLRWTGPNAEQGGRPGLVTRGRPPGRTTFGGVLADDPDRRPATQARDSNRPHGGEGPSSTREGASP